DDEVVLQSVATIQKEHCKFCLAAEGLGNRLCYLEPTSEAKYVPPDMCICNFVLEQSLSVRALQEMLANTGQSSEGVSTLFPPTDNPLVSFIFLCFHKQTFLTHIAPCKRVHCP
ncbi:Ryanodine receptor 3, partial [Ameca splendens]